MTVVQFDISFTHQGAKRKAKCEKFKVLKCPQIRVVIQSKNKLNNAYTFYEINKPDLKFFWFKRGNRNEDALQKTIEKKLEKHLQVLSA